MWWKGRYSTHTVLFSSEKKKKKKKEHKDSVIPVGACTAQLYSLMAEVDVFGRPREEEKEKGELGRLTQRRDI